MWFGSRCFIAALVTLCAISTKSQASFHRFDVKDSIEMTTFSNPAQIERKPQVCFSPDRTKFLVVTSRGEIATDTVDSDLLMYEVGTVRRYLAQVGSSVLPSPLRLATRAAVPRAFVTRSYGAVITELHWSSDSRFIYFLGEESDGSHRLYRVSTIHPVLRTLSPPSIDVRQFAVNSRNQVVFLGDETQETGASYPDLTGEQLNHDAGVVTGLSLQQILFPAVDNGVRPRVESLWFVSPTEPAKIISTDHQLGGPDIDGPSTKALSLSPDGRHVICILPVATVPPSWKNYDPMPAFEQRRIDPANSAQLSPFNLHRVRAYFIVDVQTGRRTNLIDAPHAVSFGYHDKTMVAWSPHQQSVVVTDTFLPFGDNSSMNKGRRHPCAAVSVRLDSYEENCIAVSRDQYHGQIVGSASPLQLVDMEFDGDDENSILLKFGYNNEDVSTEEQYVQHPTGWQKGHVCRHESADIPLAIYIDQNLNTPPTLWCSDPKTKASKRLLDPNPQLKRTTLGRASVYRWSDETGRKWEGGLVFPVDYDRSKRYPLVIQTHGFDPTQFLVDGIYPTAMAARPFASLGIIVLQMGYSYDHILTLDEPNDQLAGYRSAIQQLDHDGVIDTRRVGIIGFSRPAWHVAAAIERSPNLFAAATLADGVDVGYMQYMIFGEGNLGLAGEFEKINGGPPFGDGMKRWIEQTVTFHLDKVQIPVRIEAIGPMSLLSEWEDYSSLRQQGKAVDLIYIPKGQHILQSPLERLASQEGNVAWFCFWLLDKSSQAGCPVVPEQEMKRWIQMRASASADETRTHEGTP